MVRSLGCRVWHGTFRACCLKSLGDVGFREFGVFFVWFRVLKSLGDVGFCLLCLSERLVSDFACDFGYWLYA